MTRLSTAITAGLLFLLLWQMNSCARISDQELAAEHNVHLLQMENAGGLPVTPEYAPPRDDDGDNEGTRADFGHGYSLTALNNQTVGQAAIVYPDGRVLVAGRADAGVPSAHQDNFALLRFQPDGSLDTSFSTDGTVTTVFGQGSVAHAVATDSTGRIIAAGRYNFGVAPQNYFIWALARYNSDGTLDSSFSGNGIQTTNLTSFNAVARAVVIQTDNKIVLAGYSARSLATNWNGNPGITPHVNYDFVVARYNTDGALDTSWGSSGIVFSSISSNSGADALYAAGLLTNGSIVAAGRSVQGPRDVMTVVRYTKTGALDTSFATTGFARVSIASGDSVGNALVIRSDSAVTVGGYTDNGVNNVFALARFRSNGTLDSTFNAVGQVSVNVSAGQNNFITALETQDDGKILAVGSAIKSNTDVAIVRFNTNGSIDTSSFGTLGVVTQSFGTKEDTAFAVEKLPGGFYVTGRTTLNTTYGLLLARFNVDGSLASSGSLDKSFGSLGTVVTSISRADDTLHGGLVASDGRIYVGGHSQDSNWNGILVARYRTDGSLDTSFATNGWVVTSVGRDGSGGFGVAIQADGKPMGFGRVYGIRDGFASTRYNTTGALDTSWGNGATAGTLITTFLKGSGFAQTGMLDNNGKLVLGGRVTNTANYDFAVTRYNTNGTLDATFGTAANGLMFTSVLTRDDVITDMAVQPDNKYLAVGSTYFTSNEHFAVARYNTNGPLDNTFSTDLSGKIITSFGTGNDIARVVTLDRANKILVGGFMSSAGSAQHMAVVRYTTNGLIDTSFSSGGKLIFSIGTAAQPESVTGIMVQNNDKIVLTGQTFNGTFNQFWAARLTSTGALDTTFIPKGTFSFGAGAADNNANFGMLDQTGRIIIGGYTESTLKKNIGMVRIWP